MKKHESRKGRPAIPDTGPDIVGLFTKVQQHLVVLEKKIDALVSQCSNRNPQRFDQPHRQPESRQDNSYRERIMYKAVCADCNKACEVPFKPSGDRPVYCKECFASRKSKAHFSVKRDDRSAGAGIQPARHAERVQPDVRPKPAKKKKTPARKKK